MEKQYAFMKLKIITMHLQKGNQIKVVQTSFYAFQLLNFTQYSFNKVSMHIVRKYQHTKI